jgi:hypothetical protein
MVLLDSRWWLGEFVGASAPQSLDHSFPSLEFPKHAQATTRYFHAFAVVLSAFSRRASLNLWNGVA